MSASSAASRHSSSRAISGCAHASSCRSESGSPRNSASASRRHAAASSGAAPEAARVELLKTVERRALPAATSELRSPARGSRGGRPRAACAAARRRPARSSAPSPAAPPCQIFSIRRSVETDRPRASSRRARSARCFAPANGIVRPPSSTSSGPRIRNSIAPSLRLRPSLTPGEEPRTQGVYRSLAPTSVDLQPARHSILRVHALDPSISRSARHCSRGRARRPQPARPDRRFCVAAHAAAETSPARREGRGPRLPLERRRRRRRRRLRSRARAGWERRTCWPRGSSPDPTATPQGGTTMRRSILLLALALIGGGAAATAGHSARAATSLCVGDKPGCFATIQAAVDAAHDGDTITIAPGTYAGPVTIDVSVDVRGAGAGATTITGRRAGASRSAPSRRAQSRPSR